MGLIRIGHLSTAYHTAFVLMGGEPIDKRIGAEAKWRLFPTGPEMIRCFQMGELDVGYIGLPPAMIGIEKGIKIRCVAGGHVEGTVLTAKRRFRTLDELANVKRTLKQFKGKTIGTPSKGSIHDVIIRHLLREAHLDDEVTIRNFEWADFILEAMENKEVDAGCGTPPLAVLASRYLDARTVLPASAMWPYSPSYGIIATLDTIRNSREVLESFLSLHEDACNLIREKPSQAAKIASKAIGIIGKDFLLDVFKVSPKYCASLSSKYIDSTLTFISVMQKMGYITKSLRSSDIFHTELIERIHKEKPHYDDPGRLR